MRCVTPRHGPNAKTHYREPQWLTPFSQWSFDSRLRGRYEAGLHRARAIGFAGLLVLGTGVVVVTLLALGLPVPAGLGTIVAGMTAFVALVVLISFVARRPAEADRPRP